jgi:uncharacterized repeat protein (TIGR04138 family)
MSQITRTPQPSRLRRPVKAYQFLFEALRWTQEKLGRGRTESAEEDSAHVSGVELLHGVRELALEQFGYMAACVFRQWGILATDDFGDMVFELVERGEMRKTENDQRSDFAGVYDFDAALTDEYIIDASRAFSK